MNGPHISFFGRLTKTPELEYTPNVGIPFARITVAVNTYHGEGKDQETIYVDATLWRHRALTADQRCQKGQEVYIHGRYSCREFRRQDGTDGFRHEVQVKEFRHFPRSSAPLQDDEPDPQPYDSDYDPTEPLEDEATEDAISAF